MRNNTVKISYRYADLQSGDKFYLDGDSTLYTCGDYGAWWSPHHKRQLSENCRVIPLEPRKVAARRAAYIRAVCKRHNLTRPELSGYYRNLVAVTARPYQARLAVPEPDTAGELRALNALRDMGLVHWISYTVPGSVHSTSIEIVSGDWNRLYL